MNQKSYMVLGIFCVTICKQFMKEVGNFACALNDDVN